MAACIIFSNSLKSRHSQLPHLAEHSETLDSKGRTMYLMSGENLKCQAKFGLPDILSSCLIIGSAGVPKVDIHARSFLNLQQWRL